MEAAGGEPIRVGVHGFCKRSGRADDGTYDSGVALQIHAIRQGGIYPNTLDTLRRRLDAMVARGVLSGADADALFAASPCHHPEQRPGRLGKFWISSDPIPVEDGGVELLLGNWSGESTYFWLRDERLQKLVGDIGRSRILELAVPMSQTRHDYRASKAVIGTFARSLGCRTDRGAFDLYCIEQLGAGGVLAIHGDGDVSYGAMARGYPEGFVLDRE